MRSAFILFTLAFPLIALFLLAATFQAVKAWRKAHKTTFGTAAWMTPRQINAAGLLTDRAGIVLGRWHGYTLRDSGEGHVLLVAPSRGGGIHGFGGKGTTCVLPTLLEFSGDVVCVDPKGENMEVTSAWRAAHGSLVYGFDPMGDSSTTSIDLLASIRWGTPFALADADLIAHGFIPMPGLDHPESRYYAVNSANILTAVFLSLVEHGPDATMGGALRFLTTPEPLPKRLAALRRSTHPAVQATVAQLTTLGDAAKPLWSSAISALDLWRDPRLDARTSTSDVDLGAFQLGDHPTSLFLRSPENQLERLAPLMRTIVQVIIGRCMERDIDRSRRRLLFMLDEFSSMGPCLPIVSALPRMAGYGLRCALICQDLSDIERLYGRASNIVQNCSTRAFMTPNDLQTARVIAAYLGVQTVESLAESHSSGSGGFSDGEGLREVGRGLMTLDEVLRLDESKILLFLSGQPPLLADKLRWDDPEISAKKGAA